FLSGAVVRVREVSRLVLHVRHGAVDFFHEVALPSVEDVAEVIELHIVHVRLTTLGDVRRYIARTGEQAAGFDSLVTVFVGRRTHARTHRALRVRYGGGSHDVAFRRRALARGLGNGRRTGADDRLRRGGGFRDGCRRLRGGGRLHRRGLGGDFRYGGFRRRLLRGQLGFLDSLRLGGFRNRTLCRHCVSLQARIRKGGRFAGRGIIAADFCLYSAAEVVVLKGFFGADQGTSTAGAAFQPAFRRSTTTVV